MFESNTDSKKSIEGDKQKKGVTIKFWAACVCLKEIKWKMKIDLSWRNEKRKFEIQANKKRKIEHRVRLTRTFKVKFEHES